MDLSALNVFIYIIFTTKFFLSNKVFSNSISNKSEQLKLVSVIFRHGDRAPDTTEMFPNDPNYNNTFFPEGPGGLTNMGKLREYKLGQILRKKYSDFLGEVYLPNSVYARSTDYARTKMCLQLVLAALYPPQKMQIWNQELLWQPIPSNYVPWESDWLMFPEDCPEFLKKRDEALMLSEVKLKLKSFQSFLKNLTELTGKNVGTIFDTYFLYHLFIAESAMNLTLPTWSKDIFPHGKLFEAIQLNYDIYGWTKEMRKLNGGKLIYHLVEEMKKVENKSMDKNRRINLYSGHESNIVAILQALGIFKPHVPEYSSAVILEFLQLDHKFYVKVFYFKGIPETTELMVIPGCNSLCPFDQFIDLLKDVIPTSEELYCTKIK